MKARTLIATLPALTMAVLAAGQAVAQETATAPATTDAAEPARYSILLRPDALAVPAGGSGHGALLVGGAAPMSVQVGAQPPAGIAVAFSPESVQLPAKPAYANFTVKVDDGLAPGYYKIPVWTASDSGARRETTLVVKVPDTKPAEKPPTSARPASFSMGFAPREAKAAPNSTLTVALLVGGAANDTIDLAVREGPFAATLGDASAQMPAKPAKIRVALAIPADAAPGDYRIVVDGVSRATGERHDAALVLHVAAPRPTTASSEPSPTATRPVTKDAPPAATDAPTRTLEIDLDAILHAIDSSKASDIVLKLDNGGSPLRIILHVAGERHAEKIEMRLANAI